MKLAPLIARQELLCQKSAELLSPISQADKPVIAAYGLVNAGKSYLLNMLTENIEQEYFLTADQRETAVIKIYETASYIYLDTPGLDANDADTIEATKGVNQADIVLFIHQPQGELEKMEVEFLQTIKQSFGHLAENNIIVVLSKADKESQEKLNQIEKKIQQQCLEHISFVPKIFQVSGIRFKTGTQQHKDGLIRNSHIESLKDHIKNVAESSTNPQIIRTTQAIDILIHDLEELEQQLFGFTLNAKEKLNNSFTQFNNAIETLRGTIDSFNLKDKNI